MHKWPLYEAKNKLSNLIDVAMHGKAQCITKRGQDAVVVISMSEYKKLKNKKTNFKDFLRACPKTDDETIERPRAKARDVVL